MAVEASVLLFDDQHRYARSLVKSGTFPTISAVVQHGIHLVREERELEEAQFGALGTLIDARRKGPFLELEAGEADIRGMLSDKRKRQSQSVSDHQGDILPGAARGEHARPLPLGTRLIGRFAGIGLEEDIAELRGLPAKSDDLNLSSGTLTSPQVE